MSKAKEEYNVFEDSIPEEHKSEYYKNKIKLLQQWNKELEESLERLAEKHDKLHTEYIELKAQNKEMLEYLINEVKASMRRTGFNAIETSELTSHYDLCKLIEKTTGKSIDEVLNDE